MQQPSSDYPYPHRPAIPGKDDFQILENLKEMIKNGQHELFRPIPRPAALSSIYLGPVDPSIMSQHSTDQRQQTTEQTNPLLPGTRPNGSDAREKSNGHSPSRPTELTANNTPTKPEAIGSSTQAIHESPRVSHTNGPLSRTDEQNVLVLESNGSAQEREHTSELSLRDAPPLGDDRRWQEQRGNEEPGRPSILPPKDQRIYDREKERERDKERQFWPRDDRRSIARPPPEERHYEPSYDHLPRRADDRGDLYPSTAESRRPLLADRHYRPDEHAIPSAHDSVSATDRHYRPDDRLQIDRAKSSHLEATTARTSTSEFKSKPPETHPTIGVSKVAELAAANRKAFSARASLEERSSKPSLIERLNPPPSLQDRLSDPTTLSTLPVDTLTVKALEERLAPRGSSIAPQTRSEERTITRPPNGTSLVSRTPPPDHTRSATDAQTSPSQSTDRTRVDDLSMGRPMDYSRGQTVVRGPSMSTRSGYSHETSPTRAHRAAYADQRDTRTSSSYRPEPGKSIYERNDFVEADRHNPSHPYLKRGTSPISDRGRAAHPSGHSGPIPREGTGTYERRLSPSRERRDWDAYSSAYAADRNWRSDHDYRRSYDIRGPLSEQERYERDPPPLASRVSTWEPRDNRPNTYRPKSPVRSSYESPRLSEPYTQPPPLSAPAGLGDRGTSFTMQRDDRRYTGSDATAARIRPRSPSPERRRPGVDDTRPPPKRVREDSYGISSSYYPPLSRSNDYSTPMSGNGYYHPPGDRNFIRDRSPIGYSSHGGYDRRSPSPATSRLGGYPPRSYDRLPRDDRRYDVGPPPRTG